MKEAGTYSFADNFEQLYIGLRQKEKRIYSDKEVVCLPAIERTHPTYKEWKIRSVSFKKLLGYIKQKPAGINILEVGCGNGWLSAQLAKAIEGKVTGTDINNTELEQAKRIFFQQSNLNFIPGDIRDGILSEQKFDLIIFAASIQYFSSLKEILSAALKHLTTKGEIHILDSHFYRQEAIFAAKQRTKDYYASIGFAALSEYYHHHSIEELEMYEYTILQDPNSWKNKLPVIKNPFHWIVIRKR